MFYGEHGIVLPTMQGNRASSHGEGESHCFSRVVAGTWDTFSSYARDGHSKLLLIQRHQDSCTVKRDSSGISSRLRRAI